MRLRSPLVWSDYPLFLSYGSQPLYIEELEGRTIDNPDFAGRSLIRIWGFRLVGKNRSRQPLIPSRVYLQSLITGEVLYGTIDGKEPAEIKSIPKGNYFRVDIPFPKIEARFDVAGIRGGLPIPEFRRRFSYFIFVLETAIGFSEEEFTLARIDRFLSSLVATFEWKSPGDKTVLAPARPSRKTR